ncbi:hypothetical protein GH733_004083, partial [Mirounga leonina]
MDRAVAALQGEGLSVAGTVCHVGKAEDQERLVATGRPCGAECHGCCPHPSVSGEHGKGGVVWHRGNAGSQHYQQNALLLTKSTAVELAPHGIQVTSSLM